MEQNQKRIKTIVKESLKVLTKPWAIFIEELNHRWQTSSNRLLLVLGVWFGAFVLLTTLFTCILLYKDSNKAPMAKEKSENKEQKKEQVVKNSPSRSPAASLRHRVPKTS
ncbi:uncharacterized protein Gasu_18060 [Galdieria sulphuraria]|uniref:Uncharacterized protein n=1 Tax=Galdieria sulphuraria TaxID=130081 RepID=M2Y5B5_GALSU|nr:uncharacterized protein Gasu_18060 [Galdieria sulphuraria]EME31049.1 hypothetical protein Gasu_18060 [Galdieria sulphuraria]|eukprot:XP_005707569.1 hypothetical protein Gasu_18060 [Galdieria sulphuraria]